ESAKYGYIRHHEGRARRSRPERATRPEKKLGKKRESQLESVSTESLSRKPPTSSRRLPTAVSALVWGRHSRCRVAACHVMCPPSRIQALRPQFSQMPEPLARNPHPQSATIYHLSRLTSDCVPATTYQFQTAVQTKAHLFLASRSEWPVIPCKPSASPAQQYSQDER